MSDPLRDISPGDLAVLERRAASLAGGAEERTASFVSVLVFRVDGRSWGLPLEVIREIVRDAAITPVPGAPAAVRGVVSLRGEIGSVTDPVVRLGLGRPAKAHPLLVVIKADDVATALAVDGVEGVVEVQEDALEAPLPLLDRAVPDAMAGSFDSPEGSVALLSAAPLLEPVGSER